MLSRLSAQCGLPQLRLSREIRIKLQPAMKLWVRHTLVSACAQPSAVHLLVRRVERHDPAAPLMAAGAGVCRQIVQPDNAHNSCQCPFLELAVIKAQI